MFIQCYTTYTESPQCLGLFLGCGGFEETTEFAGSGGVYAGDSAKKWDLVMMLSWVEQISCGLAWRAVTLASDTSCCRKSHGRLFHKGRGALQISLGSRWRLNISNATRVGAQPCQP